MFVHVSRCAPVAGMREDSDIGGHLEVDKMLPECMAAIPLAPGSNHADGFAAATRLGMSVFY